MSIKQAVTTIFKNRDNDPSLFPRMGKKSKKFGETTSKAFKKASKSATSFSSVTKGILAAGAVQKALSGVSAGIVSVTTDFLNFDQALTAASAKLIKAEVGTKAFKDQFNELGKVARQVGATTEFNAAQAASGLDFLALAGFNAQQAMKLLPGVANLATVANVDLATATDIASDSLGAFGLMTKNTEQLGINFARVQDVMAKTTATSNTNLIDMFEAVKKGAPDFTAAGQSIETFSALIGTMANAGIKGAEAGTKLRNMAVRLTGGSKEAEEAIEALGINTADSSGNFRDMLDIIDDVIKGTAKLGEVEKARALKVIFGARQTGGLNVILKEGTERLRSYRQMLIDSKGAAEKMATVMRSSLINRLKSLGSAATEVGFQLFSAFSEKGAGAIDTLTKFVRGIDLTPMINGIKKVSKFAGFIFDKFVEIGNRTGLFDAVRDSIKEIEPIFNTFKDIITTVWGVLEDTGVFDLLATAFKVLFKAVKPIGQIFAGMWSIVKPILVAFGNLLKPLVSLTTSFLEGAGKTVDILAAPAQAGFKSTPEQDKRIRQSQAAFTRGRPTTNTSQTVVKTQSPGRFRPPAQALNISGEININGAAQGSTATTESGPVAINMNNLAPSF